MADLSPAATTYGLLLYRHMQAARKDFEGPERARIYQLIEDFRKEFTLDCEAWDNLYSEPEAPSKPPSPPES